MVGSRAPASFSRVTATVPRSGSTGPGWRCIAAAVGVGLEQTRRRRACRLSRWSTSRKSCRPGRAGDWTRSAARRCDRSDVDLVLWVPWPKDDLGGGGATEDGEGFIEAGELDRLAAHLAAHDHGLFGELALAASRSRRPRRGREQWRGRGAAPSRSAAGSTPTEARMRRRSFGEGAAASGAVPPRSAGEFPRAFHFRHTDLAAATRDARGFRFSRARRPRR